MVVVLERRPSWCWCCGRRGKSKDRRCCCLLKEREESEEEFRKCFDHDRSELKHATAFTDAHHTPLLYTYAHRQGGTKRSVSGERSRGLSKIKMMQPSCAGGNRRPRRVASALLLPPLLVVLSLLAVTTTTVDSFVVLPSARRSAGPLARSVQGLSAAREGGEVNRMEAFKKVGLVAGAWGVAAAGLPQLAGAKKIINLEEARELGEKKMIEIEKAKGPLIKVRGGAGVEWMGVCFLLTRHRNV